MTIVLDVASWALILAGSFFTIVGALGLLRMPDEFTRMHVAGLIDPLGAGLLIGGMILQAGFTLVTLKLIVLLVLLFFTVPVVTHALAQVCLHEGVQPLLVEDRRDLQRRKRRRSNPDQGRQPSN